LGCGGSGGSGGASGVGEGRKNTLVFARGEDSVGLDPARQTDGESFAVTNNLYDTLVRFKRETTEIEPALAESWNVTPDGLTYTFHLRKGVSFHGGEPFNADAVLFSFLRQMDSRHPAHGFGPYKYWDNMEMGRIVKAVEKQDDFTVVLHLHQPEAPLLANLAMDFMSIVSPKAAMQHGKDFDFHPVGTGPFIFEKWDQHQRIVLRRNDSYWDGPPSLERVIFRPIPDPETRALEFRSGAIDLMEFPNPYDLKGMQSDAGTVILEQPGLNICYLAMNMDKKPFQDVRVRRAVNHAINKEAIVEHLYQGLGLAAKNPIPPVMWSYDKEAKAPGYDPEKARALLAEAGYKDGFKTTLWVMNNPRPYILLPLKVGEAILNDLQAVGIDARMVQYDWATYLDKTDHGEHDMAIFGWSGDNGDPDNFLYVLLGKQAAAPPATNIAFYRSDRFQDLLLKAKRATAFDERVRLYTEAQRVFQEDLPWVALAHTTQVMVAKTYVKGFYLHPTTRKDFVRVRLEREVSKG
jgi:ABC-type transport system substrate-binding protein